MTAREIVSHAIQRPEVTVPGSKYLANRYIALAAIAPGTTVLKNLPHNDDIEAALEAVTALGGKVEHNSNGDVAIRGIENYRVEHDGLEAPALENPVALNCRDSGTLSRFITAVASNLESEVTIDASEQMRQRPMEEVVDGLLALGVEVDGKKLPITLKGPIQGGKVTLDTSRSSQYLSGLLIACLKAKADTTIKLHGKTVSSSYIQLTKNAIARFNGKVIEVADDELLIPSGQNLTAAEISVASDVVSSSYFMAAGLLAETTMTLNDFDFNSPQGESRFYDVLAKMGAKVESDLSSNKLTIGYVKPLQGIDVDMGDMPDVVPTLVVLALFAKGETYITNIAHLAFKESNRIVDLCDELNKLGANIEYDDDSIRVKDEQDLTLARLSSCHDHRLAMSFALIGIKLPGIIVEDAQAVEKSFPLYWDFLEKIGVNSRILES